jgi:YYY domain-containing protein
MIGIPVTLFVLALLFSLVHEKPRELGELKELRGTPSVPFVLLLALSLGAVAVINTWDLPTYLGLLFLVFLLRQRQIKDLRGWIAALFSFLFIAVASLLLYWPFYAHYQALHVGIGLVRERTELPAFLTIWGFFLFVAVSYLAVELLRSREWRGLVRFWRLLRRYRGRAFRVVHLYRVLARRPAWAGLLALGIALVVLPTTFGLAIAQQWVLALLTPLVAGAAFLLLRWDASPKERFTALLLFIGLAILLGCEVVFLKDFLAGGEWYRMNTVFKFYIQAWVLLGLGTAAALPRLWRFWRERAPVGLRALWGGLFLLLLFSSALYPLLGTPARAAERFPGERPPLGTLDGLAFMTVGSYIWPEDNRIELKYDHEAIQWLLENVRGTPVIAEADLPYYREGGMRVSSFTGLPTLLGAHQREQRYASQVSSRDRAVRDFFNTVSFERALALIEEHRISYIYVGQLEQAAYDPDGLAKFDEIVQGGELEVAYENERVKIYRVRG